MEWNRFIRGDCFDVMGEMEDKSVDFVFTSPPDISQGDWDNDIESYQNFQKKTTEECSRSIELLGRTVILGSVYL